MTIACIFCSAAGAVAVGALFMASEAPLPRWASTTLVLLAVACFGACAAEDRVCEIAERKATP